MKYYSFNGLLLTSGWLVPAYVGVDDHGVLRYLSKTAPDTSEELESVQGYALPGFLNSHSHAFQYAMAGAAERHTPGSKDDFWSWREAMYHCALAMTPHQMEAIAAMLYAEMLRYGYTHVAEFHYLHHDENGKPYGNPAEMGERLVAAASHAGIKITLVPVFYQKGNFSKEPFPQQRRFISRSVDEYLTLLNDSASAVLKYAGARLGFGVHSLRAVDHRDVVETFHSGPRDLPFHIHAAEQLKEVDDCVGFLGRRPVAWLLDNLPLNERFHLIHCTHLDDGEVLELALSKANVVLCPATEGNLGDGIFRLTDYTAAQGRWSIGTDSHIGLNPVEDLRWLDYAQRLGTHRRNTFDDGALTLLKTAWVSGTSAMGLKDKPDLFSIGESFDAVVVDAGYPPLMRDGPEHLLASFLYTADSAALAGTIIDGVWVVRNGLHVNGDRIRQNYGRAIRVIGR